MERREKQEATNWISVPYQREAEELTKEAVSRFVTPHQVVGLGSGPMATSIIRG